MKTVQNPSHAVRSPESIGWRPIVVAALLLSMAAPSVLAISARHPTLELDNLGVAQLDALLQAELDSDDLIACGWAGPSAAVRNEDMVEIIMCAFDDEGDEGSESSLDLEDIEQEMEEANTTLRAVVEAAVARADAVARGPQSDGPDQQVAAAFEGVASSDGPGQGDATLRLAAKNGFVSPNAALAANYSKDGTRNAITSVKRAS